MSHDPGCGLGRPLRVALAILVYCLVVYYAQLSFGLFYNMLHYFFSGGQ